MKLKLSIYLNETLHRQEIKAIKGIQISMNTCLNTFSFADDKVIM